MVRRPFASGLGSRAGWTVADQAVSSISNAGLSLLVARAVDADAFGAFAVAFVVFTTVIGLSQSWIVDPLVIRYSGAGTAGAFSRAAADCAGASLVAGVGAGVVCAAVALLVTGDLRAALLALAVSLPALLVQDAWRYALFAAKRPRAATANDALWAGVQFGGSAALIAADRDGVVSITLVWGAGAAAGALLGAHQLRTRPRPSATLSWLRAHQDLGTRFGVGFLLNTGAVNAAVSVVGAVAGLAAAGSLRAAQTLVGPLQALTSAVASLALPMLAGAVSDGRRVGLRPAALVSAVLSAVSAAWVLVLLLLPDGAGEQLLGDSWPGARSVLPFVGAMMVLLAVASGPALHLRAYSEAGYLLRATVYQAPVIVVLSGGGALVDGARGAAAGLAAAHLVGVYMLWAGAYRAPGPEWSPVTAA